MSNWRMVGLVTAVSAAIAFAACSSSVDTLPLPAGSGGTGSTTAGSTTQSGNTTGTAGTTSTTATTTAGVGGGVPLLSCKDEPPANAPMPPALVDPAGCPMVMPGKNAIDARSILVAVPKDMKPGEKLPVVFLWHWLGGSAQGFFDKADVQNAVNYYRFIAVAPESKGDLQFKWPFTAADAQSRVDEELKFFDRALTCVNQTYGVNRHCVASVGVSAGALWTQVLAGARGQFLSSFLSLSGGEGGFAVRPWTGNAHKMPAMVLWGGSTDNCFGVFSFDQLSKNLEGKLTKDGHFVFECIHNCGHSVPPFEALPNVPTQFGALWQFVFDHPDWLPPGASPWQQVGIPMGFPTWCAIGAGKATPRTGSCPDKPGC